MVEEVEDFGDLHATVNSFPCCRDVFLAGSQILASDVLAGMDFTLTAVICMVEVVFFCVICAFSTCADTDGLMNTNRITSKPDTKRNWKICERKGFISGHLSG